jgi:hypothetical protein
VFVRARIVIANRVSVLVQTVTKIRVNVYMKNVDTTANTEFNPIISSTAFTTEIALILSVDI